MNVKKKILLSTDIGSDIDDALCLTVIINHPDIDLDTIYTVNGDVATRALIAKKMVELAQQDIAVACGEEKPLGASVDPYSSGESYYVDDSLLDNDSGIIKNGVEHMAEKLKKERYTILSIAPLTNIAILLRKYPESAKNIEHLYIMGSRFPTHHLEHNLRFDTAAAQEVLDSDIPLTIIPGNVCAKYRMPTKIANQMKNSAVGKYVGRMFDSFIGADFSMQCHVTDVGTISLSKILDSEASLAPDAIDKLGQEKYLEAIDLNRECVNNLIYTKAYKDPVGFWDSVNTLLWLMRSELYPYLHGKKLADTLEGLIPKDVSISDVYVPYCLLHPEKLKLERKNITCNNKGNTVIRPGERHDVVMDLDYDHFRRFVEEYIF
ncbi:MAG: nucleoside hydrolase [Bacteriovoracaceae bacterium]|nr:nucleoside hydrolase [Bacteriovoracaceae bacterium]